MDNVKQSKQETWLQRHRPSTRRLVQVYSALLYNAHLKGFVTGEIYRGSAKALCVPGLNCYSCPGAVGACPLGALQNALASAGHRAGWYVFGILLLFGVMLGRTVCGWLCPLGWMQELLHRIPTPKIRKSAVTRALTWLKYIVLAVFVIALPLWYGLVHDTPLPAFCKFICPAGTLEGAMGLLPANPDFFSMLGILFTQKYVIMLVVALACVFCYRSFCRFLCPLGAIYSLFGRFSVIGIRVDPDRCSRCGACVRHCEMDVLRAGDRECIHCGKCMEHCSEGAISIRAGKITLRGPEIRGKAPAPEASPNRRKAVCGRVLRGALLAVLCFALLWFNVLDPAAGGKTPALTEESDAPIGWEPGQRLADFTAECLDGSTFRLSDCRGKVVFLNLWATWCGPCVQELPYFDALLRDKADAAVLAIHSALTTEDPAAWLADRGYAMPFTVDSEDERLFQIVHGSATLPQTIVLNRAGEVIYNRVGSVTPELLESLYEQAK